MGGALDDESDEVMELARRARAGEIRQVWPELTARGLGAAQSVPARMTAAVAMTDILVWDDSTIPIAADIAEAALGQACGDPRWELVTLWRPLVEVIVGAQVHHGIAARPRLIRLLERAAAGRADRVVRDTLLRRLKFEVPEEGAPAKWRSHMPVAVRDKPMFGPYYEEFRAGPQEWTDGQVSRLWRLLTSCREGPEIAAGLLAAGYEPGDNHQSWLWLVGQFLADGDREKAAWALQRYLGCWRDPELPSSVLPRQLPLYLWTRPLLDLATRKRVLTSPVGPEALRSSAADERAGSAEDAERARRRIERVLRRRCSLDAACVTVAVGRSPSEVLHAFGADPAEPAVPRVGSSDDPAGVSVVELPGAVLAVEDGGFTGSTEAVIRAASACGRAASMYWNDLGDLAVMFAENGVVLDSGDYLLGTERPNHPKLAALVDEITRLTVDPVLIGLLLVERFTEVRIAEPASSPVLIHRIQDQ